MTSMIDKESRVECQTCPARGGRYVPPTIRPGSPLMLIGERPGREEAENGEVFVGRSGYLLDGLLQKAGTHRELVSVGNTVACYMDGNPTPSTEEVEACAGVLEEALAQANPMVVVALGGIALKRLTGLDKPSTWRGSCFRPGGQVGIGEKKVFGPEVFKSGKRKGELKPRKVQVTLEQSAGRQIVATLHPAELGYSGLGAYPLVINDLRRARLLSEGVNLVEVGGSVTGRTSPPSHAALLLAAHQEVVIDVETDGLGGRLNLVGLSVGPDHGDSFAPGDELRGILAESLRDQHRLLIGHNLNYDIKIIEKWTGERVRCRLFDTMHASHFERPDLPETLKPKSLDTVASRLPNIYFHNWKEDFRQKHNPNGVRYNQLDCAYTFAIKIEMEARLRSTGRLPHFTNVLMPLLPHLIDLEREGVAIDESKLIEMHDQQAQVQASLLARWEEEVGSEIDYHSPKQLMAHYYDARSLEVQFSKGKGARPTLDADALETLAKKYPLEPGLRTLVELRHVSKILTTYLTLELDSLGRLHPQYNLSGTVFGRLSSGGEEGFNFQNIPRIGEGCPKKVEACQCVRLRSLFVGDSGQSVGVGDWSQIEYRLVALLGGESWLIEALKDPQFDLHSDTAQKLGVTRQVGKTVNHAANYGAGAYKLCLETHRPQIECQRFLNILASSRPSISRWQQETIRKAKTFGWVANPFGRRGYFRVGREGQIDVPKVLAFCGQSPAADMMLIAMLRAKKAGLTLRWTVHDELGISMKDNLDLNILKEVMTTPYEELGGWSCPVDLGVGLSWADAKSSSH